MDEARLERYSVVSGEEGKAKIVSMIKSADIGRLALFDEKYPYIIPMNHVYFEDTLVLHGSFVGKKTELMKLNGHAAYEVDFRVEELEEKKLSCHLEFESTIVYGEIKVIEDRDERRKYMQVMMDEYGRGMLKHGEEDRCYVFIFHIHKGSARVGRFLPSQKNTLFIYDFLDAE